MKSPAFSTIFCLAYLCISFASSAAYATKLNAPPLPHERQAKDFNNDDSETIIEHPSIYKRHPDYRELEADKKKEELEAKEQAQQALRQAQVQAYENYKKRQDMAIEENNKAVAAGKAGHWLEAISAHIRAVQFDPQNKQFRVNLSSAYVAYGQSKLQAKDLSSASNLFRKALAAAPDNGLAGKLLAQTMAKQGYDPTSADVRLSLGDQLLAASDIQSAVIEYQAAMQLESSARTYTKMGDLALRLGQVSSAITWYRQAIVKNPQWADAHRQLGLLSLMQKDYPAAVESLRKAVILNPHDAAAGQALVETWRKQVAINQQIAENHLGLACALQLTGDYAGAECEYNRVETLDPKNPGLAAGRSSLARVLHHVQAEKYREAACTLITQRLYRDALAEISQAVILEPRNSQYQFLLGQCLEAEGNYQGAHQAYLTCVLIDPENNTQAAKCIKELQSREIGMPKAEQATKQASVFSQPNLFNASSSSNFMLSRKNLFEATPKSEETTSMNSESSQSQNANQSDSSNNDASNNWLAKVESCESKQDYNSAIALLRKLLDANLQNADIHHRLACDLLASGQATEAVSEFRIASALSPDNKAYANDMEQAVSVYKRTMASNIDSGAGDIK